MPLRAFRWKRHKNIFHRLQARSVGRYRRSRFAGPRIRRRFLSFPKGIRRGFAKQNFYRGLRVRGAIGHNRGWGRRH